MPDGFAVAGLFGGAVVLLALILLALNGLGSSQGGLVVMVIAAVAAFGTVVASGATLLRGLRSAADALEQRTREVEEAGSRLKVLV